VQDCEDSIWDLNMELSRKVDSVENIVELKGETLSAFKRENNKFDVKIAVMETNI
jgi:hypothetical protein